MKILQNFVAFSEYMNFTKEGKHPKMHGLEGWYAQIVPTWEFESLQFSTFNGKTNLYFLATIYNE